MARQVAFVNGLPVVNNIDAANMYAAATNTVESITQDLYDSAAYPTGGTNALSFFQQGVGSGTGVISSAAKTLEDTNMQGNGSMPNLTAYIITSVEIDVQTAVPFPVSESAADPAFFGTAALASSIEDAWIIRTTGWLQLTIGSKPYLQVAPLMKFPASNDFEIDGALTTSQTAAASSYSQAIYGKAVGPSYVLSPNNLLLIPLQNFILQLGWATKQPITTAARLFARFMGQQLRLAQ